jgi:Periplasmic copper-binding protein (NosD)
VFVAAICVLAFSTLAEAQATRTWVSGVGDDANPCSRTAPCKTFAGAISKTATNGVISVLDPGGFGAVTITKSITLDGEGTLGSILSAGTNGINISAVGSVGNPAKVNIRNIHIDGAGTGLNGINVTSASSFVAVEVDNVQINGFTGNGINFTPSASGGTLYVNNSHIRNTLVAVFAQSGRVTMTGTTLEQSGKGVLAGAGGIFSILNSVATGNGEGFASTNPNAILNIQNSIATHNQFGISASGGSTFRLKNCGVFSNSNTGLFNGGAGSQIISLGGNSVEGNPTPGVFTGTVPPQ